MPAPPEPSAPPQPAPAAAPPARTAGRRRLRAVGRAAARILLLWAVATAVLALLAGLLPGLTIAPHPGAGPGTSILAAAAGSGAFGLLSGAVWPLLVRALLLVPALLLGLTAFTLNGALVLVAFATVHAGDMHVGWKTSGIVAAALSFATSTTSAALGAWDSDPFHRRLVRLSVPRRDRRRLALRHLDGPDPDAPPGFVFLQIDGLGHEVLRRAAAAGHVPHLAALLDSGSHTLTPWRTDWSSQTGASQLGILHGSTFDVPAFRWYEKDGPDGGRLMVCSHPATAAELERRRTAAGNPGLLHPDGASRGNLFSGGAASSALVLSVSMRRHRGRRRSGYFAYFSDPARAVRTACGFAAEVVREAASAGRARLRDERPRVGRGGLYPFVRAFATVVERDVVVSAVLGDIINGRPAVYADLVGYDEVSHHSGIARAETLAVLRRIDRAIGRLQQLARFAPRPYRFVVLSDHGQSEGEPFSAEYGETLEDVVRAASDAGPHEPLVLGSGNLGLVSFTDVPHRLTAEELAERCPKLVDTLVRHPGIGFVLVRSAARGALAIGEHGVHALDTGTVDGEDPLAVFGPGAAEAVRRADTFPHAADVMIGGSWSPADGAVHAFEEQVGSHGGLGGPQARPFLLHPADLPLPAGPLVGAGAVHRLLAGWLAASRG